MLVSATIILGIAIMLTLFIPFRTKAAADQVIMIDILSFQVLGLCLLIAFHNDSSLPLTFGLLLAMLGFVSTIVLSRFIKPPKT